MELTLGVHVCVHVLHEGAHKLVRSEPDLSSCQTLRLLLG